MFNPTYLQLSKAGIYYLRWPVPKRFHPDRKQSTIKLSLRTRDPKTALRLSKVIGQEATAMVDSDATGGMRYEEIGKLLKV